MTDKHLIEQNRAVETTTTINGIDYCREHECGNTFMTAWKDGQQIALVYYTLDEDGFWNEDHIVENENGIVLGEDWEVAENTLMHQERDMTYTVEISETGEELSDHTTYEDAFAEVERQETEDKSNQNYQESYYTIRWTNGHTEDSKRIDNGGYVVTAEDIAAVKQTILDEAERCKLPCFFAGDDYCDVFPMSIEDALDCVTDNIQEEYDHYIEERVGDDFGSYVNDRVIRKVQDADIVQVIENSNDILGDMLLEKAKDLFLPSYIICRGDNYEIISTIDEKNLIRIKLAAGGVEDPENWISYHTPGGQVAVSTDEYDTPRVTDERGRDVPICDKMWDIVCKAAPDKPELTNDDVDREAEHAVEEFKADGDAWYMDDCRGFANEWTLYLCNTDKQKAWAVQRGLREVDDEYAKNCIAEANYVYAMEDNNRAVVVLTDEMLADMDN